MLFAPELLTPLGLHDSNQARVKAAEAYMYKCDEIFVVADITRVGTNESVEIMFQQSLGDNFKNGRPVQGIALVCTRSEVDIQAKNIAGIVVLMRYRTLMKRRSRRRSSRRAKLHKLKE
jgi:hypothetical protein